MSFHISQTIKTVGGKGFVVDAGYLNQIREGNIGGHRFVRLQGNNVALDTTLGEVSALYTAGFGNWAPDGTVGVVLVSDSADDDVGGDGALTVIVRGHDTDSIAVNETVIMTGATPTAATTQLFFRIHELEVITAGADLTNAGEIIASIDGANIIALQAGHSMSTEGRDHVAAGENLYLQDAEASVVGTSKNGSFHLFTRDTTVANSPFVLQQLWQTQNGGFAPDGKIPGIPEKHDVIIVAQGTASASVAAASFQGWVEISA